MMEEDTMFQLTFFIKELFLPDNEDGVSVGIRLLDFPSLVVRPDIDGKTTYPKGKTCSFIMSVQRFIEEYKKAVYPIQLYTIKHNNHSSVSVTSQGFIKDQCFMNKLANLSLHGHINGSKTFYNRLILVPTHRNQTDDIIGNITLKITAKVSRSKQKLRSLSDHDRPHHFSPSPVPTSNPLSEIPANMSVEYLPNVWFPPPLCFTSQTTAKQCNHDDELEVQQYNDKPYHLIKTPASKTDKQCYTKPIGNNSKAVPCIDSTIRLEHCHHWKDVAGYHSTNSMPAGSFPWKGDIIEGFTHNMIQYTTQRRGQETPPISGVTTTPVSVTPPMPVAPPISESIASAMVLSVHSKIGDGQYPYLTGLFKDLMLLHGRSAMESSSTNKEVATNVSTEDGRQPKASVTDQAVQTDDVIPPKVVCVCQSEGSNNPIEVEKQLTTSSDDINTLSHSSTLPLHDEQQITDSLTGSISSATSTDSCIITPGKSTTAPLITVSRASINTLSNDSLNSGGLPPSNSPKHHLNPTLSKDSSLDGAAAVKCGNIGQKVYLAASLQSIDREDDDTVEGMTPPNYPSPPPGEAISGQSLEQLSNNGGETASSYDSNSYSDDFESCSNSSN